MRRHFILVVALLAVIRADCAAQEASAPIGEIVPVDLMKAGETPYEGQVGDLYVVSMTRDGVEQIHVRLSPQRNLVRHVATVFFGNRVNAYFVAVKNGNVKADFELVRSSKSIERKSIRFDVIDVVKARLPPTIIESGSWENRGEELVQTSRTGALAFGDPKWTSYNLELEARMPQADHFLIMYHAQNGKSYRVFNVGGNLNEWHDVNTFYNGEWSRDLRQVKPGTIESDRWHKVRLAVRGSHCRCELDGVEWFVCSDDRLTSGRIALSAYPQASFRNIVVTSPDGKKTYWRGIPNLPMKAGLQ